MAMTEEQFACTVLLIASLLIIFYLYTFMQNKKMLNAEALEGSKYPYPPRVGRPLANYSTSTHADNPNEEWAIRAQKTVPVALIGPDSLMQVGMGDHGYSN